MKILQRNCLFRPELKLAMFIFFGFRQNFAARNLLQIFKKPFADLRDAFRSFDHVSG